MAPQRGRPPCLHLWHLILPNPQAIPLLLCPLRGFHSKQPPSISRWAGKAADSTDERAHRTARRSDSAGHAADCVQPAWDHQSSKSQGTAGGTVRRWWVELLRIQYIRLASGLPVSGLVDFGRGHDGTSLVLGQGSGFTNFAAEVGINGGRILEG